LRRRRRRLRRTHIPGPMLLIMERALMLLSHAHAHAHACSAPSHAWNIRNSRDAERHNVASEGWIRDINGTWGVIGSRWARLVSKHFVIAAAVVCLVFRVLLLRSLTVLSNAKFNCFCTR
jgi:hypothetical protein